MKPTLPLISCAVLSVGALTVGAYAVFGPEDEATPATHQPDSPAAVPVAPDSPFSRIRQAAAKGDAGAQFELAECYAGGKGVEADGEKALAWLCKAAAQGHAEALFALGVRYELGEDVAANAATAQDCYERAAEKGHAVAMRKLGEFCLEGIVDEVDVPAALEWFRKASEQGDILSTCCMGDCYASATFRQPDKAKEWWEKAAQQGCVPAMLALGDACDVAQGDAAGAARRYREAARLGSPVAENRLQWLGARGELPGEGAAAGGAPALLPLGEALALAQQAWDYCYGDGAGDEAKSKECCLKALPTLSHEARNGNAEAQFQLSRCYENGFAYEHSFELAALWLQRAAEQGLVEAQKKLAWAYRNDYGLIYDQAAALDWCLRAAEQGDAEAIRNLDDYDDARLPRTVQEEGGRGWNMAQTVSDALMVREAMVACLKAEGRFPADGDSRSTLDLMGICRELADGGHAVATLCLARCYWYGYEVVGEDWPVTNGEEAFSLLQKAADRGSIEALFCLGQLHEAHSSDYSEDEEPRFYWYSRAAEKGHRAAQVQLAVCYLEGRGVQADAVTAARWCVRALKNSSEPSEQAMRMPAFAASGWERDPEVILQRVLDSGKVDTETLLELAPEGAVPLQFKLAECYESGEGLEADAAAAALWYGRAAEQGSAEAMLRLAACCEEGRGLPQDAARAVGLYRRVLELVPPPGEDAEARSELRDTALLRLAACLAEGRGMKADAAEALRLYDELLEGWGQEALVQLDSHLSSGLLSLEGMDAEQRLEIYCKLAQSETPHQAQWKRLAAEAGSSWAQGSLAMDLNEGEDRAEAIRWYRMAAEQGEASACCKLADMLLRGEGTEKNAAEAVALLRSVVAEGPGWGYTDALLLLGKCYAAGEGVPQDDREAFRCYRKAFCEAGHLSRKESASALAKCYAEGRGCTRNPELAAQLLSLYRW